ncbi:MAG TPA: peptidoglycan-binding domain-containing protein [Candidatus Pacearchaeota archaeon]|nr:peptidoglycan-binding domain-containing protein [Candidatus Pacearchaeota archaeon]
MRKVKLQLLVLLFFLLPISGSAFDVGDVESFNIESSYEAKNQNEVSAVLVKISNELLFYIDQDWWESLDQENQERVGSIIYDLGVEFENHIYPKMTSTFGKEPVHTVDKSGRTTVIFHNMARGVGGYFNSGDQYSVYQNTRSNERNMIYISTSYLESPFLPGFLAHEFMHLITFNQKERRHKVVEEVWLNEARAEYIPTFLGYENNNDNLERRMNSFLKDPNTSLTEWEGGEKNYGVINMFTHYLVDHYGVEILIDSLFSKNVGIKSINDALKKNGYSETFADIFTDWTIAIVLNDCNYGDKYCYLNPKFEGLKVLPDIRDIPSTHSSSFSQRVPTKNWLGRWYKIVGGKDDLVFEFDGESGLNYQVPYILCDYKDKCIIDFIELDENNNGKIVIEGFNDYSEFIFIPSLQSKIAGFNGKEKEYYFSYKIATDSVAEKEKYREFLLNEIRKLQAEIERLQSQNVCRIEQNLSVGSSGESVVCLQEFLKKEGSDIYPEGLVTGNFFNLTKNAVIRFQEKYASEILAPLGLTNGTGFVDSVTRAKINSMIR